jgi:hypothetical protein
MQGVIFRKALNKIQSPAGSHGRGFSDREPLTAFQARIFFSEFPFRKRPGGVSTQAPGTLPLDSAAPLV